MRKILIIIASIWCAVSYADSRSESLLNRLSTKIGGYAGYEVVFRVNIEGQGAATGNYLVRGNSFYIKVDNREIYSNSKVKYEVNGDDREVVIDNVNPNDKDLLTNPTKAFEFVGGNFTHVYQGTEIVDGKKCDVVVLKPTTKAPYSDITLMLDGANGLPVAVRYRMAELSSQVEISVVSVTPRTDLKDSNFNFDKGRYKGFELIDFR